MDTIFLGAIAWPPLATDGFKTAITDAVQGWLAAHPLLYWIVGHPLLTLGLAVVCLFLFWGLLQAIARFTEAVWLWILQVPIRLVRWSWTGTLALIQSKTAPTPPSEPLCPPSPRDRLEEVLQRLESLRQEQDNLIAEMKTILSLEKTLTKGDPLPRK